MTGQVMKLVDRREQDRRHAARKDAELLTAAAAFNKHMEWCPECRDSVRAMCNEGARLMEDIYLTLRTP
jgi:hypothetical protein